MDNQQLHVFFSIVYTGTLDNGHLQEHCCTGTVQLHVHEYIVHLMGL
jgi:hypothetical protein